MKVFHFKRVEPNPRFATDTVSNGILGSMSNLLETNALPLDGELKELLPWISRILVSLLFMGNY